SVTAWGGRWVILAAAAGLAAGSGLAAQTPPEPGTKPVFAQGAPYHIVLDQLTGSVAIQNPRGRTLEQWTPGAGKRSAALASIPPRRPVVVDVLNANPLLYRYDVSATAVAQGNQKGCTGLGSRFAST